MCRWQRMNRVVGVHSRRMRCSPVTGVNGDLAVPSTIKLLFCAYNDEQKGFIREG
jgi:hypothetical protein